MSLKDTFLEYGNIEILESCQREYKIATATVSEVTGSSKVKQNFHEIQPFHSGYLKEVKKQVFK